MPEPKRKWSDFTKAHQFPSRPAVSTPAPPKVDMSPVNTYLEGLDKWLDLMEESGVSTDIIKEISDAANKIIGTGTDEEALGNFTINLESLPFYKEVYGTFDAPKPPWQFKLDYEKERKKLIPPVKQVEQPKSRGGSLETQTDPATGRQIPLLQTDEERMNFQRGLGQGYGSIYQTQADIKRWQETEQPKQTAADMLLAQRQAGQRNQGILRGLENNEAAQRAELFRQFEEKRQEKLSNLDPEMDWIQTWFAQHEENPNKPIIPTTQDRIDALGGELSKWQSIGQNYADAPVNPGDSVTWGQVADQSKNQIMQMLEDIKNAPPDAGSDSVTARPIAPETPSWLPNLVPQLTAGQPIRSNVELPTPSLQQWSTLSPSNQVQYAGFSKWAGTPIKDTLARMNLMRTETPRGASNFRWSPPKQ